MSLVPVDDRVIDHNRTGKLARILLPNIVDFGYIALKTGLLDVFLMFTILGGLVRRDLTSAKG